MQECNILEDCAFPIAHNLGQRGKPSRWARLEALAVELPEIYPDASFREVQERALRAP